MQTTINWTNSINWVIASTLLIVLIGQLWLIARNQSLPNGRKWLRAGLNALLWLVLVGFFLQIQWPVSKPATHALLVADNVPSAVAASVKDSLRIQESFTSRNFKPEYDSVTLVGQNFPTPILTQLSSASLRWIPYYQPDQLQNIRWKGLVRQGEIQHVTGRLLSSTNQTLRLRFGNKTVDSVALHEGENPFSLHFPAFTQGHTQTELTVDQATLDTLHFFTRRTEPLTVQFLLNSPDFESKTLAGWLGKHGHTVQLSATLSKDISSNVSINKAGRSAGKTVPDLIITEPANANNVTIRKAIADGKAVLFINLTNPETDCRAINQAVGSLWQVRKTSNEATVPIGNNLTALPYRFVDNLNQFTVPGYPIAVQQTSGRVGVSLLSETYPLSLSGDSVTYNRVWMSVLARLSHADKNSVLVNAPIYSGIQQAIFINNPASRSRTVRVGNDTLPLTYSPINDRLAAGTSSFSQSGWQPLQDSLAVYIDGSDAPLRDAKVVRQFVLAHNQYQTMIEQTDRKATAKLPNWAWLLLIVVCFTALWVEPKF
ncbi:hypothetical protein [Spirosoma validum]|uniref:Aerotolerance regulator N-terminal domain-containing protein n=1 Tax=Spirosoma validum TaxID=2771355 RepID=A0A927B601_9BACT|nr:hypothetical protein [Spirosoma validum]MBD2756075.1 hypothetical protein [Spirosoma validum]